MSNGTRILVTSKPRGVFEDIKVVGTPKPGTLMEIKPSTDPVANIFSYQPYGTQADSSGQYVANDGDKKAIAILVERDQDGKTFDDAYVDGDMGRIYWPVMGEQFNMLVQDIAGTGDDHIIGEEMMAANDTTPLGTLLIADSDAEAHPFTLLEASTDPTDDAHMWCRFNGAGGA